MLGRQKLKNAIVIQNMGHHHHHHPWFNVSNTKSTHNGLIIRAFHRSRDVELDNHARRIALPFCTRYLAPTEQLSKGNSRNYQSKNKDNLSANQCTMITLKLGQQLRRWAFWLRIQVPPRWCLCCSTHNV
jgi:hypothetical protein